MLVLAGVIHHLRYFCLGNLIGKHATFADTVLVNVQHDARCFVPCLAEIFRQHGNDEFHRRVIIIEQQYAVHARLFGLGFRARDDRCAGAIVIAASVIATARRLIARTASWARSNNETERRCRPVRWMKSSFVALVWQFHRLEFGPVSFNSVTIRYVASAFSPVPPHEHW